MESMITGGKISMAAELIHDFVERRNSILWNGFPATSL